MDSRFVTSAILGVLIAAPVLAGFAPVASSQTLPDTSCASAVGVGENDIPHAYYTANGVVTFANDACPDHYSGELGFGVGGAWLFSREGPSTNGGDGVVACYGSDDPSAGPTTGHHGSATTINVQDDVLGGAVAFSVTRDYNRTPDNPFLPSSNNAGDFDCGDGLVEPCDPADPTQYTTAPGCNPLDESHFVFPATGLCTGLHSLGDLLNPDPANVLAFILSLLGGPQCSIPGATSWTVPGGLTLADYAGADGATVLFFESNVRFDAGHFGTGTSGKVWTSVTGFTHNNGCTASPVTDPDGVPRQYACTYYEKDSSCGSGWRVYAYHSNSPFPRRPVVPADYVVTNQCSPT